MSAAPRSTAMVVGCMVGAGVFSLPARFGVATGILGSLIAWAIAGAGMLMLAFVFQNLAIRKPELDSGVFIYAKAGFGDYAGFNSAIGFWASAMRRQHLLLGVHQGDARRVLHRLRRRRHGARRGALVGRACGCSTILIARGVREAAGINRIVTVFKIIPILVFIVVLFFDFDAGVFADNWAATGYGDLGDSTSRSATPCSSRRSSSSASRARASTPATPSGARTSARRPCSGSSPCCRSSRSSRSVSYAVMPQPELAATRQPSMVGVFESVVGDWGAGVHQRRRDRLGARRLPRVDADGRRGDVHPGRATRTSRRSSAQENAKGTPITALVVTSLAVQALLAVTLFLTDALNFMLDLCTSLALIPYFLAAAYALKLGLTGRPTRA